MICWSGNNPFDPDCAQNVKCKSPDLNSDNCVNTKELSIVMSEWGE